MSILKNTNSGIHAKLTPTYIVSFGYTNDPENGTNVFFKRDPDHKIIWVESKRKFKFNWTKENGDPDSLPQVYAYWFDTVAGLKVVEQYWWGKTYKEQRDAFSEIEANSEVEFDFFSTAKTIFAKTVGSDLVSVQPMEKPQGKMFWMDSPLDKKPKKEKPLPTDMQERIDRMTEMINANKGKIVFTI